jgi:hypothetical protein
MNENLSGVIKDISLVPPDPNESGQNADSVENGENREHKIELTV